MPDFDVDFCMDRRPEVVERRSGEQVRRGQGGPDHHLRYAQAQGRAQAIVARVLDIGFTEANTLSSLVPDDLKVSLKKLLKDPLDPEYVEKGWQENHDKLMAYAQQGVLLPEPVRHGGASRRPSAGTGSTHAAGVVIGKTKLTDYVPFCTRTPRRVRSPTQFTMDQLEECGLVKMDFLGLATLTLIRNTLKLMAKRGIVLTEADIPDTDAKTFQMLSEGKSASVFQFESSGMQKVLKQARPTSIEDLIALNALYRPGPMEQIPSFIQGKHNPDSIKWLHPKMGKHVLEETYGVIVYQEQVMDVARASSAATRWAAPTSSAAPWARRKKRRWTNRRPSSSPVPKRKASPRKKPNASSTTWCRSPATASTRATPRPTRCWPTRPRGSKPTTPPSTWPPT